MWGPRQYLKGAANISDGLALVEEQLSGTQLADDLFGSVAFAFHGASPGQVWPAGKLSSGMVQFLGHVIATVQPYGEMLTLFGRNELEQLNLAIGL